MANKNKIAFIHNSKVPEAKQLAENLVSQLSISGISWISSAGDLHDKQDELNTTHVAIIIGGDGTILRAIRVISPHNVPVVGIKMGKVGFMAELTPENALQNLKHYINYIPFDSGSIRLEKRMMITAHICMADSNSSRLTLHALNDISVSSSKVSRLVELKATVNNLHLTNYRADAIITSTATGSTGYSLSAGGPIIFPEAEMMLLQPVAAHTGLRDGLILAPDSVIELSPSVDYQASISADGFIDSNLDPDERIIISKSKNNALFLRSKKPDFFYEALNMRLGLAYRSQRPVE